MIIAIITRETFLPKLRRNPNRRRRLYGKKREKPQISKRKRQKKRKKNLPKPQVGVILISVARRPRKTFDRPAVGRLKPFRLFRRDFTTSDHWSFKRAQYEKALDRFPPDSCRVDDLRRLQKRIRQLFHQDRFPRPYERDRRNRLDRRYLRERLRRSRDDANERRELRLRTVRAERLLPVRSLRFRARRLRRLSDASVPGRSMIPTNDVSRRRSPLIHSPSTVAPTSFRSSPPLQAAWFANVRSVPLRKARRGRFVPNFFRPPFNVGGSPRRR